jgi:hypothetical protein
MRWVLGQASDGRFCTAAGTPGPCGSQYRPGRAWACFRRRGVITAVLQSMPDGDRQAAQARATASAFAGVSAIAESEPLADDLARQVQDCRVVEQDEFGVGGQENRVQFEGQPVGVLAGGQLVLF